MSHAVETLFYVREVPWHRLGTRVEEAPDSDAALVLSGLNWAVLQQEVAVAGAAVAGYRANVRSSDGAVLGIVRDRYTVLQNAEVFRFADSLLGSGVRYETAGALYGGRRIWILARLPDPVRVLGDQVLPYLCITNSHDGEGAIRTVVTPVRVVCQNTLSLALSGVQRTWSTRHTGAMTNKLTEAARALDLTRQYLDALQEQADLLTQIRISRDTWTDLVQHLLPEPRPEDWSPRMRPALRQAMIRRMTLRRSALTAAIQSPDLHRFAATGWAAVNAVIDFADHVHLKPETEKTRDDGFARVLDDGQPLAQKAMDWLLGRSQAPVGAGVERGDHAGNSITESFVCRMQSDLME